LRDAGWPVLDGPARWRVGELTLAWDAVAPHPL
ncbi:MAG TPA: class I SAM-dependent methyltransferase, partial [Ornithinibacter sp.]|nr:class I SAM-dependent methyltransferase [Ornithinibacter sp.]